MRGLKHQASCLVSASDLSAVFHGVLDRGVSSYVVAQVCVIRYDNERGKGDHRHWRGKEQPYAFSGPRQLLKDFEADIKRWNRENSDS